jgi:SAM-dependent methyltransferase
VAPHPRVVSNLLLSNPAVYNFTQWLVGAERPRRYCVKTYGNAFEGARVVDIGCGPGLAVRYLPRVEYVGIEPNPAYVESARRRFGNRAQFRCGYFDAALAQELAPYDLVLLLGVVHHCDDATADRLFADIRSGLAGGGRVVTLDPCFTEGQSVLSRYVAQRDRGRYVRSPEGYRAIGRAHFKMLASETRDGLLLIPTTVHIGAFGFA